MQLILVNELTEDPTVLVTDCEGDLHLPVIGHGPQTAERLAVAFLGTPFAGNQHISIDKEFRRSWRSQTGNRQYTLNLIFDRTAVHRVNIVELD